MIQPPSTGNGQNDSVGGSDAAGPSVVVAATFTVDPLVEPLSLLLREAGVALGVEVAPHAQVFQALLDPGSSFAQNKSGVNVVLIRFEDWLRDAAGAGAEEANFAKLGASVEDLVAALGTALAASPTAILLGVCPPSARFAADPRAGAAFDSLRGRLTELAATAPSLHVLADGEWIGWDPSDLHDPEGDRLAQLPYTPLFFAAMATVVARRVHAIKNTPPKVLVLDCDGTLWKGAVGEEGTQGIEISARHRALQELALSKKKAGMVLCLASKNVEPDVLDVFNSRQDMALRLEDLVATRLNWLPKSENLKSLAAELNLGLDSFVFIDDNPVECAEIEANCPGVLVIQLPVEDDFPRFVSNVWPLDILRVTEEDTKRSDMYRANLGRERFAKSATSLQDFLAGLELRITIAEPREEQLARVAQLTHRTNQFNITTRRRTEAEIRRLSQEGLECRAVEVSDRFGDYGLVGDLIFATQGDALVIDTFLLSCRVLGRGVEHAMMRELGALAVSRGLARVVAPLTFTPRNQPARRFLDGIEVAARSEREGGASYTLQAADAAALVYQASGGDPLEAVADEGSPKDAKKDTKTDADKGAEKGGEPASAGGAAARPGLTRSARWARMARDLDAPAKIVAALAQARRRERSLGAALQPARTETERKLATIWAQALGLPEVGVSDDYFDLGGTSLLAVGIFARIEREMGKRLPLALLTECPTLEAFAARIDRSADLQSLVPLNQGGSAPPLFLVHDADGETLLYRNLALRLPERAVFGIQPPARADAPILYTRIEDMAAHYVAEIRKAVPHGPYLLGGLCAGGVLALEMARQLEAAHETARLVAVFDAADVEAPLKPHRETSRRFDRVSQALRSMPSLARAPRLIAEKASGYLKYEVTTRLLRAYHKGAVEVLRVCLDRKWPIPKLVRALSIRTVYLHAESKHRPQGAIGEEIVLFRATTGTGAEEPYIERYADPLLGWARRSRKGVRAVDVPGGHGSMLQEPNVAAVADVLRAYLAECEAVPSHAGQNGHGASGGDPRRGPEDSGRDRTSPASVGA